ncbi:MAG: hypothetical protein NVSMB2_09620 [Chloroflexota bacterium]
MVLVLRPGALGDTLLAVPALRVLKAHYGRVLLAAHGGAARLLQQHREVDLGVAFDDPRLAWAVGGSVTTDALGRGEDVVAWMRAQLAVAPERLLVQAPGRPSAEHEHCAAYLVRTLPFFAECDASPIGMTPIRGGEVLVHPGSGAPAKNWAPDRFAATVRALDTPVRLIVGEADEDAAAQVEAALGRALPRIERPTLMDLAARLAGCTAYLGNDSGISHLAGLCGTRSVVMFGPTRASVWAPLGPHVVVRDFETHPTEVAALLQGS